MTYGNTQGSNGSRLSVEGSELVYFGTGNVETWRLLISDIVLVAEYTTAAGSWNDDYFLEFGTLLDGEPAFTGCAVPGGSDACLEELGVMLGAKLTLKLFDRTDFASRVIWPLKLAGRPVFVARETAVHVGLARLRRRIFGGDTEWVVSAEVFDAMGSGN